MKHIRAGEPSITVTYCACGQQPTNHSPPLNDFRTEDFVGWMNVTTDVSDEVTPEGLALRSVQILKGYKNKKRKVRET